MSTAPRVSAVIPAYNAAAWIGETLESVFTQDHGPVEVIVVDDGSTDGTATEVARFGGRARCVQQVNSGQAAARNRGVAASRGEFVAFLDSDDLWLPGKTAAQVALLEARPAASLAFCNYASFGDETKPAGFDRAPVLRSLAALPIGVHGREIRADLLAPLLRDMFCQIPSTWMVRRSAFDRIGGFDERLRRGGEDWLLAARLALVGSFVYDDRVLARRRERAGSHSRSNDEQVGLAMALDRLLETALPSDAARTVGSQLASMALNLARRASASNDRAAAEQWLRTAARTARWLPPLRQVRLRARLLLAGAGY
ncbi:MAG: glycosyltransferase family 2 protein [Burkholderiales bacterium]|nr:glycosyltransferase family 2 protein [Burkholderiales bacterium]